MKEKSSFLLNTKTRQENIKKIEEELFQILNSDIEFVKQTISYAKIDPTSLYVEHSSNIVI